MKNYGERAAELFDMGYNCAQSVAGAFAEECGMELERIARIASSFGGGIAGTRNVCGAVSGMLMAAGLMKGYSSPDAKAEKQEHYAFCKKLMEEFSQKNGSCICSELLNAQKDGEKRHNCKELCRVAADLLAEYMD